MMSQFTLHIQILDTMCCPLQFLQSGFSGTGMEYHICDGLEVEEKCTFERSLQDTSIAQGYPPKSTTLTRYQSLHFQENINLQKYTGLLKRGNILKVGYRDATLGSKVALNIQLYIMRQCTLDIYIEALHDEAM